MIDVPTMEALRELTDAPPQPTVSVYLPTHRTGPELAQDPIRLRNLLRSAMHELTATGWRAPDAEELVAPASALVDDEGFWADQEDGLALFVRRGEMIVHRLPATVEELVVLGDRCHVTPLVPVVAGDGHYFVLALTQGEVRLLRATRHTVTPVELEGMPSSMEAALRYDDRERRLQHHSSARVGGGRIAATFHGHAEDKDLANVDLGRFLRLVDDGVSRLVGGPPAPLVLAGTDRIVAAFRGVSRNHDIVDEALTRDPGPLTSEELHALTWPLVEPRFAETRHRAEAAVFAGGETISTDVAETVRAAARGRVAQLVAASGEHRWGTIGVDAESVDEHEERRPGDRDLIDAAVVDTMRHGGEVFVLEPSALPEGGPLAALLRF